MIRVMLVAASPVVRAGLAAMLTTNPKLTIVGSASNLDVLPREVVQLQPDVVLLDLSGNPQTSVWEKLLLIQEEQYPSAIIVIVDELDRIDLEAWLRFRYTRHFTSHQHSIRNCRGCRGDRFWFGGAASRCY